MSRYLPPHLPWQVHHFPSRVRTARPPVALLLDCSELELARTLGARRGRIDDAKEAVARRLQTYRRDINIMSLAFLHASEICELKSWPIVRFWLEMGFK